MDPKWQMRCARRLRAALAVSVYAASVTLLSATGRAPRLIVVLVVDQFRGDYVDKFQQQWTGGLKRLLDDGAYFGQANYEYAETVTCAGHATISTGAWPSAHGMIGTVERAFCGEPSMILSLMATHTRVLRLRSACCHRRGTAVRLDRWPISDARGEHATRRDARW